MKLGVNIDHIATLRNARGQDNPNLIRALKVCQEANIDTLTVHLREDRRHIKDKDLFELKKYSKPKIGLVWSSSSSGKLAKFRSMDIKNLQPIITKQYHYFSLQNSISENDNIFLKKNNIIDFGSQNLDIFLLL